MNTTKRDTKVPWRERTSRRRRPQGAAV